MNLFGNPAFYTVLRDMAWFNLTRGSSFRNASAKAYQYGTGETISVPFNSKLEEYSGMIRVQDSYLQAGIGELSVNLSVPLCNFEILDPNAIAIPEYPLPFNPMSESCAKEMAEDCGSTDYGNALHAMSKLNTHQGHVNIEEAGVDENGKHKVGDGINAHVLSFVPYITVDERAWEHDTLELSHFEKCLMKTNEGKSLFYHAKHMRELNDAAQVQDYKICRFTLRNLEDLFVPGSILKERLAYTIASFNAIHGHHYRGVDPNKIPYSIAVVCIMRGRTVTVPIELFLERSVWFTAKLTKKMSVLRKQLGMDVAKFENEGILEAYSHNNYTVFAEAHAGRIDSDIPGYTAKYVQSRADQHAANLTSFYGDEYGFF